MTSPLVRRLVSQIDECRNAEMRGILVAELACYWARVGEFTEAERLRKELRRDFGDGKSARVSILIMCSEALHLYYQELSPNARDRMARASLLSKAVGDGRLIALTSAWLAHIYFNLNRFDQMATDLRSCLCVMSADDGTAECRASLVLGDAFLFVGDVQKSQVYYERARSAAVSLGDQAAVGAMTYNRAALRVARARFNRIDGKSDDFELSMIRGEVQSAINYQAVAQLRSLDHLLQAAQVGVLMLAGSYADAETQIRTVLDSSAVPANSPQWLLLSTDLALALARLGREDEALTQAQSLSEAAIDCLRADDRALALASLVDLCRVQEDDVSAERYRCKMNAALTQHLEVMQELAQQLSALDDCLATF